MEGAAAILTEQNVLAVYALRLLTVMEERGHSATEVLAHTGIRESSIRAHDGRITALQYGLLVFNARRICGDGGIAFEMGLRTPLTTHGFLGLGLMSSSTLGQAIELGRRFLLSRLPFLVFDYHVNEEEAILDIRDVIALGPLREFAFEMFMVELFSSCKALLGDQLDEDALTGVEICFQHACPSYFDRYRQSLPKVSFDNPSNQIRFPVGLLKKRIRTANPVTVGLVIEQCERELSLAGENRFPDRVRGLLVCRKGRYPDLQQVAARLSMSSSNLKRLLQHHGSSFMELRDEVRCRDSQRLLSNPDVPVERVAHLVGYNSPANFTRAFRKWTGETPTAFRQRRQADGPRLPLSCPPV